LEKYLKVFFKGQEVAIKSCKETIDEESKKKFVEEGRLLQKYDHENIVKFIGIAVDEQPMYIIMELMKDGSLLSYLRQNRTKKQLPLKLKLKLCRDCTSGIEYFIHRPHS